MLFTKYFSLFVFPRDSKMVCHFWQQFLSQFFFFRMTFLFLSMTALRITNTKLSDRLSELFQAIRLWLSKLPCGARWMLPFERAKKLSQKLVPKMTHHFVEGCLLEKQTVFHKILEGWDSGQPPLSFDLAFINCLVTLAVLELFITGVGSLNQAFFSTEPKKLKDEKTQNSSKKLKDSANFGVIYCKNQRKGPKIRGKQLK